MTFKSDMFVRQLLRLRTINLFHNKILVGSNQAKSHEEYEINSEGVRPNLDSRMASGGSQKFELGSPNRYFTRSAALLGAGIVPTPSTGINTIGVRCFTGIISACVIDIEDVSYIILSS